MRSEFYGSAVVPVEDGRTVTYTLLCDEAGTAGPLGCEFYGVRVEMGGEAASRPCLTASKSSVSGLLEKLVRGGVTPVGLGDVVDDWLEQ
ncbi:MAG: DUF6514 family protein [Oscillospiraceae bacterium]|jgi:hypothetical protein|nr:DUF6514 family protein [Oscillospiraceae bacterium]